MVSATSTLAAARQAAEALMGDSCTITAPGGRPTYSGGITTFPTGAEVYDGPCKVQTRTTSASTPEAGGQLVSVLDLEVHVPVSVTGIEVGHLVEITDAPADPELEGRRFRVTALPAKSLASARRLACEEITT